MSNLPPNPYNITSQPQMNANPGPQFNHGPPMGHLPSSQLPPGFGGVKPDANSNSPLPPSSTPQNMMNQLNNFNQSASNSPAFNHSGMMPPIGTQSSPIRPANKPLVTPFSNQSFLPPNVQPPVARQGQTATSSPLPYPPNNYQHKQINDNAPPLIPTSHNQPLINGPPMAGPPSQFPVSSSGYAPPMGRPPVSAPSFGPGSMNTPFGQPQGPPQQGPPVSKPPGPSPMTSQPNIPFSGPPMSGPPRNSPLVPGPPISGPPTSGPPGPISFPTNGPPLGPPRPIGINGPSPNGPPVQQMSGPPMGPPKGPMMPPGPAARPPMGSMSGPPTGPPMNGPPMAPHGSGQPLRPPLSGPPTSQPYGIQRNGPPGPPMPQQPMPPGPQSQQMGQAPPMQQNMPPITQQMGPPMNAPPSSGQSGPPSNMQGRYPQMPQANYANHQQMPPQPGKQYPQQQQQYAQGLTQQMGQLSVTKQGFDRLWGHQQVDLMACRHILPEYPEDPPEIRLQHQFVDAPNCSPDIFRCTVNKIPDTNSLLQKSRLPLGILIHPFKDLNHLPVIQCTTIVRCRACRTYINPFVYFVDAKRWKCNLCYRVNDLPEEFQYDPVSKSYGDPSRRPEIKSATIEFIAPGEYMLRPPQPAVYLFLMDVSQMARESGYLQILCDTLKANLDQLPGDARTQVGFICYDAHIHYYLMSDGLTRPKEMTVLDIDDVFLPSPESLLVNLGERKELVKELLTVLPQRYSALGAPASALGAALQAAYKLMSPTGGRVTVFQTCLPNAGPGALQPREDPNARSSADVQHLNPATDFYKRLALDCSGAQVAVDLFLLNQQYADLATLSE
ncbi:hypothetical protein O0L34_g14373 [Tuta absoluta]|nr:hypothetical protein O0L34_g14373 [Tuta absoluta]